MKKITLLFSLLITTSLLAQTISLSNVTSATVTVNASDIPVGMTPNTPFIITLSDFTANANSSITIFNQFRNEGGQQFAGGGIAIALDGDGNGTSAVFNPGFFGGGNFTMDQNVTWNAEIGGSAVSNSITFPGTYDNPTLSTIELTALEEATLSPNPTEGVINLIGRNVSFTSVEVYNTLGSLVGTSTDLSNLNEGLYLVKIYTNGGSVTKKIIKN